MKDFFKRNSPIFYIGIFVAVVFIFIIILGQNTPGVAPTLQPTDEKELISDYNPVIGLKEARVTIVEFLDYNCPSCKALSPTIKNILEGNKNKVKVVVKHLPLVGISGHETSYLAAQAVQASTRFNKATEMHYGLLELESIDKEKILDLAERVGINKEEFSKTLDTEEVKKEVDEDLKLTEKLQVRGTPTLFLNGKLLDLQKQDLNTTILAEINKIYPQQ